MANIFADYTPRELNQVGNDLLQLARDKQADVLKDETLSRDPFAWLTGDASIIKAELHHNRYFNLAYPTWKNFAPKFCSTPPVFLVKELIKEKSKLADCGSKLFAFKSTKFDYQDLILRVCQDAFFLPIGYGRHTWDSKRGLTKTSRFNPSNVIWDHTATDIPSAKYVIEKHKLKRYEFALKYGDKVANLVTAADSSAKITVAEKQLSSDEPDKHPLDEIEYYLLWTKHCGVRRVYPFLEKYPSELEDKWLHVSKDDGKPGEPWPLQFDEDDWHLTPLELSKVNSKIGGLSKWQASRSAYLQVQDLLGAMMKAAEESAKKVLAYPLALESTMAKIRSASGTLTTVGVDFSKVGINDIRQAIQLIEMPGPDDNLLQALEMARELYGEISGYNSVIGQNAQDVQTAAEANTLAEAASNSVADDQGAVERWVKEIGRKELGCDMGRVPRQPSLRVNRSDYGGNAYDTSEYQYKDQGEFPDASQGGLIHDIPDEDAVLLEKGVADIDGGKEQLQAQQEARATAVLTAGFGAGMATGSTPEIQAAGEQAAAGVELSPEVAVRQKYKIPLDASVVIANPGIGQFIGPDLAPYWEEDLSPRQIDSQVLVSIQTGSSTSSGRMQRLQEVLMLTKLIEPRLVELQMWDQVAELHNALIDAAEIESLKDCKVDGAEMAQKYAELQAQQAKAAQDQQNFQLQQQLALKQAAEPLNPNTELTSQTESNKIQGSVDKQVLKNQEMDKRLVIEQERTRNRTQNPAQLQMGSLNGA